MVKGTDVIFSSKEVLVKTDQFWRNCKPEKKKKKKKKKKNSHARVSENWSIYENSTEYQNIQSHLLTNQAS